MIGVAVFKMHDKFLELIYLVNNANVRYLGIGKKLMNDGVKEYARTHRKRYIITYADDSAKEWFLK